MTDGSVNLLAACEYVSGDKADAVLAAVAQTLQDKGVRTAGVVQINRQHPGDCRCDMDLKVLPDGPVHAISMDLGSQAKGCRLDPGVLEIAVADVQERIAQGCEIVLVNKFGKRECEGKGFAQVIGEAVSLGIPVVVGVSVHNRTQFDVFADGLSVDLALEESKIINWCSAAIRCRREQSAA